MLKLFKRYGTLSPYPCPKLGANINIVAFSDAIHSADQDQVCFIICMVYEDVAQSSSFHLLAWACHKSRRSVKSTLAAEALAAIEALDQLILLRTAMIQILGVKVRAWELVDTKDL